MNYARSAIRRGTSSLLANVAGDRIAGIIRTHVWGCIFSRIRQTSILRMRETTADAVSIESCNSGSADTDTCAGDCTEYVGQKSAVVRYLRVLASKLECNERGCMVMNQMVSVVSVTNLDCVWMEQVQGFKEEE